MPRQFAIIINGHASVTLFIIQRENLNEILKLNRPNYVLGYDQIYQSNLYTICIGRHVLFPDDACLKGLTSYDTILSVFHISYSFVERQYKIIEM